MISSACPVLKRLEGADDVSVRTRARVVVENVSRRDVNEQLPSVSGSFLDEFTLGHDRFGVFRINGRWRERACRIDKPDGGGD